MDTEIIKSGHALHSKSLPVTSVNLTLSSRDEHVVDDIDGPLHADGGLVHVLHVLKPHLVVEQWLQ